MEYYILDDKYPPIGSGVDRTPGLHLSDILEFIELHMGVKYGTGWDRTQVMDSGFVWERHLERTIAEVRCARIGEVELDGILMSPDGLGIDKDGISTREGKIIVPPSGKPILMEYKWTWKSSINMPWDNWRWMTQIKSYLKGVNMDIAIMHIAYVNGNNRGSGPQYRLCWMRFEQEELDKNWEMIIRNKNKLLEERNE